MDLIIKRDTEVIKVEYESNDFVGKDGVYENVILSFQDKVGDMDFNKGEKFMNMRVQFNDGRTRWLNVKYKDADVERDGTIIEGNYVQTGVNFVTALRDILILRYEEEGRPTTKFDEINGALIVKEFVDKKIPIYLSYYNTKGKDGKTYFNLSSFFSPVGTKEEAIEKAKERKLEFIEVEYSEESQEVNELEDDYQEPIDETEEDDWDDWDDWDDDEI